MSAAFTVAAHRGAVERGLALRPSPEAAAAPRELG